MCNRSIVSALGIDEDAIEKKHVAVAVAVAAAAATTAERGTSLRLPHAKESAAARRRRRGGGSSAIRNRQRSICIDIIIDINVIVRLSISAPWTDWGALLLRRLMSLVVQPVARELRADASQLTLLVARRPGDVRGLVTHAGVGLQRSL